MRRSLRIPLRTSLAALALALPASLLAATLVPVDASAKTVTWTYDFADPSSGNQGFRPDNDPPGNTAGGPWYSSTFTPGQGLKIVPTGNGGTDYHDARGTWWVYAPPGSTVTRVRLDGLDGKAFAGQLGRVWLASLNPDPQPRPPSVQQEIVASGATWTNQSYTLAPPVGSTAQGFGLWLFTRPCDIATPGSCKPADPADGAFVSLRRLVMTIDDPSRPTLDVQGLAGSTLWTNQRQVDLTATGNDPQTGIGRLQAEIRTPTGTRTLSLGTWKPDLKNVVPRGDASPPLPATRTATRSFNAALAGRTTVVVRATNGTGLTTASRGTVRVDRDKPTITWPKTIKPGATVRLRDALSGISTATLTAEDQTITGCKASARVCLLRIPGQAPTRAQIVVRAEDQAGNRRESSRRVVAGARPRPDRRARTRTQKRFDGKIAKARAGFRCTFRAAKAQRETQAVPVEFRARNLRVGIDVTTSRCSSGGVPYQVPSAQFSNVRMILRRGFSGHSRTVSSVRSWNRVLTDSGSEHIAYECIPDAGGAKSYRFHIAQISGVAVNPVTREQRAFTPKGTNIVAGFRCPSRSERMVASADAWSTLIRYNPKTKRETKQDPNVILAAALRGEKPPGPPGGWEAHHIVPVREQTAGFYQARAALFDCHVYPNSYINGVYLRGFPLRQDQPGYRVLRRRDRRVMYHGITQGRFLGRYSERLAGRTLRRSFKQGIVSRCGDRERLLRALRGAKQSMLNGSYLPRRWEPGR